MMFISATKKIMPIGCELLKRRLRYRYCFTKLVSRTSLNMLLMLLYFYKRKMQSSLTAFWYTTPDFYLSHTRNKSILK